jgi:quinol monooxygenase YgiN
VPYDLHTDDGKPPHFLFFEDWTSVAHLQAHLGSPDLTAFQAQPAPVLAEPLQIVLATCTA